MRPAEVRNQTQDKGVYMRSPHLEREGPLSPPSPVASRTLAARFTLHLPPPSPPPPPPPPHYPMRWKIPLWRSSPKPTTKKPHSPGKSQQFIFNCPTVKPATQNATPIDTELAFNFSAPCS